MKANSFHAPRSLFHVLFVLALLGCSTTPRVLEVSSRKRLQDVDIVDHRLFTHDQASRLRYKPTDLSADAQREEFYVRWTKFPSPRLRGSRVRETPLSFAAKGQGEGSSINIVKFEYRQVNKPNTVLEQTYTPHGDRATVFAVRGEDFHSGGPVSAWRVSLWQDDQLLAERKSTLW
jgi:hypothetical protein